MTDRILWNRRPVDADAGDIDEIVLSGVDVHIEQMTARGWWIGLYRGNEDDSPYWMGNFVCDSQGRMSFVEQESHGIVWGSDDEHQF